MTANAVVFIGITIILGAAGALAWLGIGQLALSGSAAIERDGIARGERAPRWAPPPLAAGTLAPLAAGALRLILFADHSLKSFPSVTDGLRALSRVAGLEIVVLTRGPADEAAELVARLGLDGVRVIAGSPKVYGEFNVRVMPFAIFTDADGVVRASSLVNYDWQLDKLWRIAGIPPEEDGAASRPGPAFRVAV